MLVALFASYLPVLGAPFIWDDHHLIERTPLVQQLHPISDYLEQSFWQSDDLGQGRTYYRPLTILSLAIDHHLHGDTPGGFHLTNLLVHALSTALLFFLLRVRGAGGYAAAFGSTLWAISPRLTEAVAWISGRTDVLAGFFVIAALLFQARSTLPRRALCAFCLLLALLCKEAGLAGVAAVLVTELTSSGPLRVRLRNAVPTFIALGVYGVLRAHAAGVVTKAARGSSHWLAAFAAVGRYFVMLLTPWFPNVQIGRLAEPRLGYALLGVVVLAVLAFGLIRHGRRLASEQLGPLAMVAVGFALVLHVVPFSINVVAADRFLYLPLLGLTLLLTPTLARLRRSQYVAGAAAFLAITFGAATYARADAWANEVDLWTKTYRDDRENEFLACNQLGSLYVRAGMFAHALSLYRGCPIPPIGIGIMINNGASVLARSGHYAEAARQLGQLDAEAQRRPIYGFNLALFKTYLNDFDGARFEVARSLTADPKYPSSRELERQLPELERRRKQADALPEDAAPVERARLMGKLGLGVQSLRAWRAALTNGRLSRGDFEEGFAFALSQGDARTIEDFHRLYVARFGANVAPDLQLAYDIHRDLVARLLATWGTLNLDLLALPD